MTIKIKRGLNINLTGKADKTIASAPPPETYSIKPAGFIDVVPKLLVQQGDEVLAGTPLFFDKQNESVQFCSPVSGEIAEIVRGDKRRILEIKILADSRMNYHSFGISSPDNLSRQEIIDRLLISGVWPFIRQRPFGIIARPQELPKSVFVSAFDSSPLAPDLDFIIEESAADFQAGLDVLKKLTEGKLHLNIHDGGNTSPVFSKAKGVQINTVSGPHPAGNVGVQIHHIDPVNKGEVVWCVNAQDVPVIGRLFTKGIFDTTRILALTGSQVLRPAYYRFLVGAGINHILGHAGLKEGKNRVISGNVLTGEKIGADGHLNFYDTQITVIPEGGEPEFIGWLKPGFNKFSVSRAFFSWLTPRKKFTLDTNLHGEERPFVISGQYEQVLPMDIYPVQLLKSILVEDLDLMEQLGIYEVVEEDFALCEFICTSKIESQKIIRKGLNIVRKELT